jgi:hypothetical protein
LPAFGTTLAPVRTSQAIDVNSPDGYMTDPPGDLWWIGLHTAWTRSIPAAVTRATAIIVNPLVRMPWHVTPPDGARLELGDPGYPVWLADPMLLNGSSGGPNSGTFDMLDRIDRFDLWARWIRDALWVGVGLLAFAPDSAGQPRAGSIQLLDPARLYRGEDGWALATRSGGLVPIGADGMVLGHRLVPLRHSLPGGVFGRHRAQLELAGRLTSYAAESLDSAVPSGVLSTDQPINPAQADQTRTEWESTQQRRRIAVLGNGARYQQVVMSPVEAELVAMARLSNEQVAHMFELAAFNLDASTNSMTYSNAADNRQELVDGPLASWSARLEETLSALMSWGTRLTIDFTRYTTPTTIQEAPGGPSDPA